MYAHKHPNVRKGFQMVHMNVDYCGIKLQYQTGYHNKMYGYKWRIASKTNTELEEEN